MESSNKINRYIILSLLLSLPLKAQDVIFKDSFENTPPVILSTPVTSGTVGTLYSYDVDATDINGDILAYYLTMSPAGMVMDPVTGEISWTPEMSGNHAVAVEVSDGQRGFASQSWSIGVLPLDPVGIAPVIDPTVVTTVFESTKFLYEGESPIQTGVEHDTIDPVRAAVISGKVITRGGSPLPGVTISILHHEEFGQTLSRSDGKFDMVVNGGGLLTVDYTAAGSLPSQRQLNVPWQDYVIAPDVALVTLDPIVTTIDMNSGSMQMAQGSMESDDDGERHAVVLFPRGTTAELVMPDGSTQEINSLDVRATEYTVGPNGPAAMPGELPPSSGYTYAVELSADEAIVAGATDIQFNQPVYNYVENFIGFPVGTVVPTGYYDRQEGLWIGSDNGLVIEVVSETDGLANVDVDGDGIADSGAVLDELDITDAERQALATAYSPGESLWRVPITHFTPWDHNWPYGPPGDSVAPKNPGLSTTQGSNDNNDPCTSNSSIIECQNQVLGERIAVTGTAYTLNYRSSRMQGRKDSRQVVIPVSGPDLLPDSLKRIEVSYSIAGQSFNNTFAPESNLSITHLWDGKNRFGQDVIGTSPLTGTLSYKYDLVYTNPSSFAQAWGNAGGAEISVPDIGRRGEVGLDQSFSTLLKNEHPDFGLGGWSLDVHMYYDPFSRTLYRGDGSQRNADSVNLVIDTIAGTGVRAFGGDGGPAIDATFSWPFGLAFDTAGNLLIADSDDSRYRKIDKSGIITTIAGNGEYVHGGDGGPAIDATFNWPRNIAIGPGGAVYIDEVGEGKVRRIDLDGTVTTIAGNGSGSDSGDDGPATEAGLASVWGLAVGKDGSVYISTINPNNGVDSSRVRRISPEGIINTIAGGTRGFSGDGGLAINARLGRSQGLAVGRDGTLYIADSLNHRIRAITPDGIINTVAGNGNSGQAGDGGLATEAALFRPQQVTTDDIGNLYILSYVDIRKVDPNGIITTIAGAGATTNDYGGDGGPATLARFDNASGFVVGPDKNLYIADSGNQRIRRISQALPGLSRDDYAIPSEDGAALYLFSSTGRHLQTLSTLTGVVLYEFNYDSKGLLITVTDDNGNVTTIERDGSGDPVAIVGPFGQRTTLSLNPDGYLSTIVNPASEQTSLEYTPDGLVTKMTNPMGNFSQYSYDSLGRLIMAEDAAGGTQTFVLTELDDGIEISRTTAMGRVSTYSSLRNATGHLELLTTDPTGAQTRVQQQTNGDLFYTYPDGMNLTYKSTGEPRFGTAPFFVTTQELSSPSGLINTSTQTRTVTLATPRDPLSLITEVTESNMNGRTYTTVIDTTSMTTSTTTPEGRVSVRTFDDKARVTRFSQDPGLADLLTTYDSLGRISKIEQGNLSATYGYDSLGRLNTSENAMGEMFRSEFDDANRPSAFILPSGRTFRFDYDLAGNLISIEMPNGAVHDMGYSAINQLTAYTPAGNINSLVSEFNVDRQRIASIQPGSRRIDYLHDATTGRTDGISYPEADIVITYADTSDRAESINWTPGDASPGQSLAYQYDGSLMTNASFAGSATGDYTFRYNNNFQLVGRTFDGGTERLFSYDEDGLPTGLGSFSIIRSGPAGKPGAMSDAAMLMSYGFNTEGRLMTRTHLVNAIEVFDIELSYDAAGRITQKTETVDGVSQTSDYIYDLDGQLLEVRLDGILQERYEYDVNGNRTLREISGSGETTIYDSQDRIQSHGALSYSFDQDGFLTQRGTMTFQYSARGELLNVNNGPGNDVQYAYDGFGRRVARTDSEGTTQYLYGNPNNPLLLTEVREPDATLTQYFYDEAGLLFAMDRDGTRYYIATDQVGTPRLVSDASGSMVKRMTYDSWGVQIEDSNPAFSMPFGFAGGLATTETGMVRFGFRDYDPLVGRWMARDPILYQGGQANLFVYANNDPVNHRDPSGLICIGASVFDVVGIGAKLCLDSKGASACAEAGVGFGGGFELDLAGGAASATDKSYASASAGGSCGPFSAGVGIKLDSCGEVKKSCGVAVGAGGGPGDGFAGKLFKGFGFSCSGSAKAATDPTVGEKIESSSKKFNVNKVKCSVGVKAVVGACVTASF